MHSMQAAYSLSVSLLGTSRIVPWFICWSVVGLGNCLAQSAANDDEATLQLKVIGVYRKADANYVRAQIDAALPENSRGSNWSFSGNFFTYKLHGIEDVEAFSRKIAFGKVIQAQGQLIRVVYHDDIVVPPRFHEKPDAIRFFDMPPEDQLRPALQKHAGDWWAALNAMGVRPERDSEGRIVRVKLPPSNTTDETLAAIADLTSLKALEVTMCRHITDEGLRPLAGLPELEELNLFASQVGNSGQAHLSNLTNLKRLQLSGLGTEAGLRHLAELTQLESLSIGYGLGYPVTAEGLSHLQSFRNLTRLRMDGCEVSDEGLEVIAKFTKLERLMLQGGTMTDAGLAHLSELAELRRLDLQRCSRVGDAGLLHLSPLVQMTHLNLTGTGLTGPGLKHLASMQRLFSLSLRETNLTDAGMESLEPLPELRQLQLGGTAVADAALEHLATFPKLLHLDLSDTAITNEGLQHLARITRLQSLQLANTAITDAGLRHLENLRELRSLNVSRTSIGDQGLQYLRNATKLTDVRASESGVSEQALRQFNQR